MTRGSEESPGIRGRMASLYDVFVDWEGRLGREMPGIEAHLRGVEARRVLDVGCGTGRHVQALRERGFEAHGADASGDMLDQARELLGSDVGLHLWRLGDEPPSSVMESAPFDAVTCMGNVWPQILSAADLERTGAAMRAIVRPGGLVVLGMKAVAVRRETGNAYMPLLRRVHEGRPLWFIRFVDFGVESAASEPPLCDLHMVVVSGDAGSAKDDAPEALLHRAGRMRVWSAPDLLRWFEGAGFVAVTVSGRLADPEAPAEGEDVFVRGFVRGS